MASTFTIGKQTVMGSWRVLQGTLTCTDGASGTDADTGLETVIGAVCAAHEGLTFTASGTINMLTAASAATVDVIVFGL